MSKFEQSQTEQPRLKIYTLGRFALVLDGESLMLNSNVQKRPLDLLKALVALGGRQVSDEKLAATIWPDADGDAAHTNFHTTLHRLRKVIGASAVIVKNGMVSLDHHYCWTDIWNFERALSQLDTMATQTQIDTEVFSATLEQAAALYQGHFLERDTDQHWSLYLRDKLRNRYLQTLRMAMGVIAKSSGCAAVLRWHTKAIEVSPLGEEFYFNYMACLAAQDQRAQALSVYDQCHAMLASGLGVSPSHKTQTLLQQIKSGDHQTLALSCSQCQRALSTPLRVVSAVT